MSLKAQSLLKTELKEKEEDNLSGLLFANHPLPLLMLNTSNIITDINDAASGLLGYSFREIKGKNISEIIPGYQSSEGASYKLYTVHCGQLLKDIRVNERSFTYGGKLGKLLFITDVTNINKLREGLSFRIELEKLLIQVSNNFINVESGKIDQKINSALELIGKFSDADRCYVFRFHESGTLMSNTHEWCAAGISTQQENLQNIPTDILPWWVSRIKGNEYLYIEDIHKLPREAAAERAVLNAQDVKSLIAAPVSHEENTLGFIGFDFTKEYRNYDEENLRLLQFTGGTIASALVRKEADEKHRKSNLLLQEAEARYKTVVNNIREVLFQTDKEGCWMFLNPAWEKTTGYSVNESLGQKFWKFVHPDDKAVAFALFRVQKKLKQPEGRTELKYINKTGETRWCEVFLQLTFDQGNEVKGTFGTITDITLRKQTQAKLELRDKAINAALNGIVITDPGLPDNPVIFCNPAFEKITGYTFNEVAGKNCRFLQGPDTDRDTVAIIRNAVKKESNCRVVIKNYRKDGTPFWNSISISPIRDAKGKLINFVGIQMDITERVKVETALSTSERKYRSVVENIKEVIFQTDKCGNWIYLNPAWEEITGFSVEESLGKPFINYVHPHDRQRNMELFEPLIQQEKDYCRHVVRYVTKSGLIRHIEVFARLTFDDDENISGTAGTLNDLTDRIKAEEDIKAALSKEKDLSELKSRFISTVSHEFRTPLTTILASSELLERYIDKWDNNKKIVSLKRIQESVDYMNSMITDVLTLNKAETGVARFSPKMLDIITLGRTIFEEVKLSAGAKHNMLFEYSPEVLTGLFDEKLVRQFTENMLSNAVKYSPKAGTIKFSIKQEDAAAVFTVQDFGIGIPVADQAKLFQPFFRGANIEQIPGTGLGLSILQKAVELHRGTVSFESEQYKGTTFTVKIPVTTL